MLKSLMFVAKSYPPTAVHADGGMKALTTALVLDFWSSTKRQEVEKRQSLASTDGLFLSNSEGLTLACRRALSAKREGFGGGREGQRMRKLMLAAFPSFPSWSALSRQGHFISSNCFALALRIQVKVGDWVRRWRRWGRGWSFNRGCGLQESLEE